ncbi:MAG: thioredoxin domain-containing protein [Elusimicrobia bacterium]|nr:thioredoxin domain-containing protein [Elusimicrobiota bacterium]
MNSARVVLAATLLAFCFNFVSAEDAPAAAPSPAPEAAKAPEPPKVDKSTLYKHLQRTFNTPPGVEFELGEVKPSPVEGLWTGALTSRFRGNEQKHQVLLSSDGRYYVLSEVFELGEAKDFPGMLAPKVAGEEGPPAVHVSKDMKYFFIGEARDLKVDPDQATLAKINLKNVQSRGGSESAPVVLVEYSDIQCPFCRNAHLALEDNLEKSYGKKVRWVFKHFPLTSIHPWAYPAAIAVACAEKQKPAAAWKIQEALFKEQESVNPGNLRDRVVAEAKKAGLKQAAYETCVDKQETKDRVDADMAEARTIRVNSTPTLVLNGRMIQGFRDFDSLKTVIDEMIKDKESKKNN